jgi:hypothetical protein
MPYFGIPIRNGLPIGLGSVAGFGVQQFSPADLFSAGEQGAWYDPSDLTTLFDDSAGTTPVTAVEQFVGLMLDKSKGLVLGSELATGILGSTSGWTFVGAANVTGGAIVFNTPPSTNASAQYNPIVASGKWYQSTITITGTGQVTVQLGSAGTTVTLVAPGTYTFRGLASGGTPTVLTFSSVLSSVNNFVGSVTAISVRELPGNHATQTTSAKRPKLAARYNLLTYTEQFDNAAWTKSNATVTANAVIAPDGTTTADKLVENAANAEHLVFQSITSGSNTISVYAKAAERSWLRMGDSSGAKIWFDLANGTLGSADRPASIQPIGNGWYRCSYLGSNFTNISFLVATGNNVNAYTGDGTSGIYIWGADLRPASQATGLIGPTYQRVVDAATYDTAGFLPYLQFDGLDDSMSTNSIDFSAVPTDKMTVWAGVRKQAASLGMIAELSASVSTNNGSFYFVANNGTNDYGVSLKGTAQATYQPVTYTNPITNVLSAAFDIGAAAIADENKPRVNGVLEQDNPTGADAGTGNFGNYPLYIGQRGGSTLPFNGWLTSLIVRGAQSTQGQIEATESWVAGKTGVSL